jgi:cytochrome c peroxidase
MILEHQVGDVVHNVKEMNGSMQRFSDLLAGQHQYAALFREAYPDEKNPFLEMLIANAISSYMRSLVSLNSRFDQFMRGNDTKLTKVEQQGFNLFMGKAKCGTCHFMPVFNGLVPPVFTETESEVLGVPARKKGKPVIDEDLGKYNFTQAIIHKHAFKTPTLRNVALTAPYMHNGVFRTLEEVVDFYNKGGGAGLGIDLDNQTLPADKLNLSRREQKAIVTFLKTLTDTSSGTFKRPL